MNSLVFLNRIVKRMKPAHVMAFIVAAVSGVILLVYRWVNPDQQAEKHFRDHDNQVAYRVMEACYVVILAAAAFNFRYLLYDLGGEVVASAMPSVAAPLSKALKGIRRRAAR